MKPIILVVCEGKVTEPDYFNGMVRAWRNPRVRVEIPNTHGTPRTLVEHAKSVKAEAEREARRRDDENLAYDEVWCVFDIDAHPNVAEARCMAESNGIQLAVSNPCFELWLLLHLRDNPGCQHRHDMQKMLGVLQGEHTKSVDFLTLQDGYEDAVKRARHLDKCAAEAGEAGRCPTTGVYRLTESIRGPSAP